jgi:DNA-binding LacI/PurR family transcriptional regulator
MPHKHTIGVISPRIGGLFWGDVLTSIREVAHQRGFRVIGIHGTPREIHAPSFAWDQVAGWIVMINADGIEPLAQSGTPLVTLDVRASGFSCPAVLPDNRRGVRSMVHHLADHGHRRIGFIGHLPHENVQERYEGYVAGLADRGLELDRSLVFEMPQNTREALDIAAQQMLDAGIPCTALVACNDASALLLMEKLQSLGCQIPQRLAIVGFDDLKVAQYTNPPLTTIRMVPQTLGKAAARLLFDQIAGQPVPETFYVPTAVVLRRSCGCNTLQEAFAPLAHTCPSAPEWRPVLARQLVERLHYPAPLDPSEMPEDTWPGVTDLLGILEAAVAGGQPPLADDLQSIWQRAIVSTTNIETFQAILALLQQAGHEHLAGGPEPQARLAAFMDLARMEMIRALHTAKMEQEKVLEQLLEANHEISMVLLKEASRLASHLTWLGRTSMKWGCLGLWADRVGEMPAPLAIAGMYSRMGQLSVPESHYAACAFPPAAYLPAASKHEITALYPIRSATRDWGVLAVHGPIDTTDLSNDHESMATWTAMFATALERQALLSSLAEQQTTLRVAYERERALADTVRELGCPVIPLFSHVLLFPLIGAIDTERSQQIVETILHNVGAEQATIALLDITGVPVVDTQVADSLLQTARAATLLGARSRRASSAWGSI